MGQSMAGHLLKAGYPLSVFSRTKNKTDELVRRGAHWCDCPSEAARSFDFIISIVSMPTDVQSIYLDDKGIINQLRAGSVVIDMTTSSPSLAEEIYLKTKAKGASALDAPVSGGDIGAREKTLSIMVGGDQETYEKALPIFNHLGKNIMHQGPAGTGQHTKLTNQIVIAGNMIGMVEGIVYARKAGLDLRKTLATIQKGAAGSWSLNNLAPRILNNDLEPGFRIDHFIKDMELVVSECERLKLTLPGLDLVRKLYHNLALKGNSQKGTQALILALEHT
jgi:3-hydroxyisobutyrate dehydrogenase